jgi:hypothetical protein
LPVSQDPKSEEQPERSAGREKIVLIVCTVLSFMVASSTFWGEGFLGGAISRSDAPPWNFAYMSIGYVLAVPAMALILFGLYGWRRVRSSG